RELENLERALDVGQRVGEPWAKPAAEGVPIELLAWPDRRELRRWLLRIRARIGRHGDPRAGAGSGRWGRSTSWARSARCRLHLACPRRASYAEPVGQARPRTPCRSLRPFPAVGARICGARARLPDDDHHELLPRQSAFMEEIIGGEGSPTNPS